MLLSPFRVCRCPDEALQYKLLQFTGMAGVLFDFFQTGSKIYLIQKLCNISSFFVEILILNRKNNLIYRHLYSFSLFFLSLRT